MKLVLVRPFYCSTYSPVTGVAERGVYRSSRFEALLKEHNGIRGVLKLIGVFSRHWHVKVSTDLLKFTRFLEKKITI